MSYFLHWRIKKIKDRLVELEKEAKILNDHVKNITDRGVMLVHKLNSLSELEAYLIEYSFVIGYLSNCSTLISEFSTRLELLLLEQVRRSVTCNLSPAKNAINAVENETNLEYPKNGKNSKNSSVNDVFSTEGTEMTDGKVNFNAIDVDRKVLIKETTSKIGSAEKGFCTTKMEENGMSLEELSCISRIFPCSAICDEVGNSHTQQNALEQPIQCMRESTESSARLMTCNSNYYYYSLEKCSALKKFFKGVPPPSNICNSQKYIQADSSTSGSSRNRNCNFIPCMYHLLRSITPQFDLSSATILNYYKSPEEANHYSCWPKPFQYTSPNGEIIICQCISNQRIFTNEKDIEEYEADTEVFGIPLPSRGLDIGGRNDDIRPLSFTKEVGSKYSVTLGCLISPSEFYVTVQCEELVSLTDMKIKMKDYYQGDKEKAAFHNESYSCYHKKKLAFEILGSYAVGYVTDHSEWVRVKILDWRFKEDNDKVHVFCIDDGRCMDISLNLLQPMDSLFREYPQFSQKCYLSGILPAGNMTSSKWSDDDNLVFQISTESVENRFNVEIEIIEYNCADDSIGVRLIFPDSEVCINDKLIAYGIAKEAASFRSERNESEVARENKFRLWKDQPHEIEDECLSQMPEYICQPKGNASPFPLNYMAPFKTGKTLCISVTCVVRFNKFYCVKDYRRTKEPDILEAIVAFLNDKETECAMVELREPPEIGQFVIAKFKDGLWYRGKVLKLEQEPDTYKVLFLDYGNADKVDLQKMRRMEREHLKYPFQMIECHLDDITLAAGTDIRSAMNFLCNRIDQERVSIKIKHVLNRFQAVYSVKVYDNNGVDIEEVMVSDGYCVY